MTAGPEESHRHGFDPAVETTSAAAPPSRTHPAMAAPTLALRRPPPGTDTDGQIARLYSNAIEEVWARRRLFPKSTNNRDGAVPPARLRD